MTYNFDPDRWLDNELAVLDFRHSARISLNLWFRNFKQKKET